jgi:hypothetical protein
VPPETDILAVPELEPKQLGLVEEVVALNAEGSVTVVLSVAVHPFTSLMETV